MVAPPTVGTCTTSYFTVAADAGKAAGTARPQATRARGRIRRSMPAGFDAQRRDPAGQAATGAVVSASTGTGTRRTARTAPSAALPLPGSTAGTNPPAPP